MFNKLPGCLAVLLIIMVSVQVSTTRADITVTDSSGSTVTFKQSPKRVVSLAPHATELIYEAGGGERVVAVTKNSDYPSAATRLPSLGPYNTVSLEAVLSYQPDLVLVWPGGTPSVLISRLEHFGIPLYRSGPETIDQIAHDLRILGNVFSSQQGASAARDLLSGWSKLQQEFAQKRPVPVFIHIWDNPLITLNDKHVVSSILKVCGGFNIFADAAVPAPQVTKEEVIARRPALIVEGDHRQRTESDELKTYWQSFASIPAVKNGDVYSLQGDFLLRPTPRLLKGAEQLCSLIDQARQRMD